MQRFADRPFSTWRNIELALTPYKSKLRSNRPGVLVNRDKLLDQIMLSFQNNDFMNDNPLTGEFLLGYHTQRNNLWTLSDKDKGTDLTEIEIQEV
jgi:CRISPR-associated protein Csd1